MNDKKIIGMAADHAGYAMKEALKPLLKSMGYEIRDFGTHSEESMDYPDAAHPLGYAVESGEVSCGIAVCGSGNGISMTLNHHPGVRAALCWTPEIGALAKQHNNANVLCLPGRFIPVETAEAIVRAWFDAQFEGGRHQRRIDKIAAFEREQLG